MRRTFGHRQLEKDVKKSRVLSGLATAATARACRVYNDANFTHDSTGNYLAITFNSERNDTYSMHSTTSNTSRITFAVAGWYYIWGAAVFDANATGVRRLGVRLGGSTYIAATNHTAASAGEASYLNISTLYYFAATNYIELMAYQNSGGNLDVLYSSSFTPEFSAIKLA
jgi:hypothetical protein